MLSIPDWLIIAFSFIGLVGGIGILFYRKPTNGFMQLINQMAIADCIMSVCIAARQFGGEQSHLFDFWSIIILMLCNLFAFLALGTSISSLYILKYNTMSSHLVAWKTITVGSYACSCLVFTKYIPTDLRTLERMHFFWQNVPTLIGILVTIIFIMTIIELNRQHGNRNNETSDNTVLTGIETPDRNQYQGSNKMKRLIISYTFLNLLIWVPLITFNTMAVLQDENDLVYMFWLVLVRYVLLAILGLKGFLHFLTVWIGLSSVGSKNSDDDIVPNVVKFIGTKTLMKRIEQHEKDNNKQISLYSGSDSTV
ncbi:hypothetical protein BC833DRAFT_609231 [Globomyces pollinis-pini]|nr:hypothetical protein BC833DRAFT_609231 [Globomyces pollinis-pini]